MLVVYTHTKCYAHDAIYIFIMPLFFALSGYFFNEGRTIKENIKNKFNSLIIPYIFYFLLVQCLFILVHKFFYQDIYFVWGMFFKPYWAVGPMWFFWGLFFTSVFFTLIAKVFKKTYLIILLSLIFSIGGYFLFDMGEPVKIVDLAKRMIKLSNLELEKDIKIEFTGLRPGEKLYEELLNQKEHSLPTYHNKIFVANNEFFEMDEVIKSFVDLEQECHNQSEEGIVRVIKSLVRNFKSNNSRFEKLDAKE